MTQATEVTLDPAPRIRAWRINPYVLLWLGGGALALVFALLVMPASHVEGHFIPNGNDSFYHARRILDAVADLSKFYQFDPKLHVPEGVLIVWPWGYDLLLAVLTRIGLIFAPNADPISILVFIPPAAVFISMAAIIGITRRLGLSFLGSTLVVTCFALLPLVQSLHGVGNVDHHYAEFIFCLSSIWALLRWLAPDSRRADAILAGVILGIAPAFHTDLFILQIPFVLSLVLIRLRGVHVELRFVRFFAGSLVGATLLACVPSLSFRLGHFAFYELSWFQLYAAVATALFCLWFARSSPGHKSSIAVLAVGALLAVPGLTQVLLASQFLAGDLAFLGAIDEAASPFSMVMSVGGPWRVSSLYSLLIWVAPVVLVGCLVELWRSRALATTYFWLACTLGLVLLLSQYRFHNFGSIGLIAPLAVWAERFAGTLSTQRRAFALLVVLLTAVAYAPALGHQLFRAWAPSGDMEYSMSRAMYPTLEKACKADPGVVLAVSDDGSYLRYHAPDCGVISNNFIITREDERKLRQVADLTQLSPQALLESGVPIKYVFVHLAGLYQRDAGSELALAPVEEVVKVNPRLVVELSLTKWDQIPRAYELLHEVRLKGEKQPYGRLFKVHLPGKPTSSPPAPKAADPASLQ